MLALNGPDWYETDAVYYFCMRFQVPQNLDIPDTILFGLNFKQLLYLGGALGVFVTSLLFIGGFFVSLLVSSPFIVFALLLSFFTYNSQSFIILFQAIIRFLLKDKLYIWEKEGNENYTERKFVRNSTVSPISSTNAPPSKVLEIQNDLFFEEPSDFDSDPKVTI